MPGNLRINAAQMVAEARSRIEEIDAGEAIALLGDPDVVIVDFQFDDVQTDDGLQIIGALRDLYPEHPPASIMITANRTAELQVLAKQLGIPLLHKPLRAARLRSLLESVSRNYDSNTLQTTDDLIG